MCMLLHSGPNPLCCLSPVSRRAHASSLLRCQHDGDVCMPGCASPPQPCGIKIDPSFPPIPFSPSPSVCLCFNETVNGCSSQAPTDGQSHPASVSAHTRALTPTHFCMFVHEWAWREEEVEENVTRRKEKKMGSNTETWRKPLMEAAGRRRRESAKRAGDNKQTLLKRERGRNWIVDWGSLSPPSVFISCETTPPSFHLSVHPQQRAVCTELCRGWDRLLTLPAQPTGSEQTRRDWMVADWPNRCVGLYLCSVVCLQCMAEGSMCIPPCKQLLVPLQDLLEEERMKIRCWRFALVYTWMLWSILLSSEIYARH